MSKVAASPPLERRIDERREAVEQFIGRESARIAEACHEMARRFARGGLLVPFGTGAAATDAAHAAVEFMHPVIVGKRALPALAPTNDPSGASTADHITRPDDIALGLAHAPGPDPFVERFIAEAARRGLLTIAMLAERGVEADFSFAVETGDPWIAQEVQETTYHVLWELVHVFFEHPGLLEDACITCGDVAVEADVVAVEDGSAVIEREGLRETVAVDLLESVEVGDRVLCHAGVALERLDPAASSARTEEAAGQGPARADAEDDPSGFLYPFLGREEHDLDAVLADVRTSTERKASDVIELRAAIDLDAIAACAGAIRERLDRGGRLVSFGNGGSSTDAQDVAADALGRGWPAAALTNDVATVTAVGNDVGFDKVFARQLIPLAGPRDVALAITTSGNSQNVVAGLEEAHRRRMLTCAIAGYDGGRLAELEWLDHLFVVPSDYIPRIQEAQATVYHLLVAELGAGPALPFPGGREDAAR